MRFLLAPDSFKESMTSKEACDAMEKGIKKVLKDAKCIKVPIADGGEGTVEALVTATNGKIYKTMVLNPLGEKIEATFGILGNENTAIIEMATASGLNLIKPLYRNPLLTTTYGTGQLIEKALDMNVKHIILGIGGSATNDGGAGMIQALGAKLLDENGKDIPFGGSSLCKLKTINLDNLDKRLKNITIEVACDVENPLTGINGASYVFGPQKGATPEMVKTLDKNLIHYGNVIKEYLNIDVFNLKGSGAAGGLGAALVAFLNGKLTKGIDLIIEHTNLEEKLKDIDFVLTGEGCIDYQTLYGKTLLGIANISKEQNVKVIAFSGKLGQDIDKLYEEGITSIFSIMQGVCCLEDALQNGQKNLEITVENVIRLLNI